MEKQNKYTDIDRTNQLIEIGFQPIEENGFQIHELMNVIPEEIVLKKTYHRDGSVFIDWKKKTRFFFRFSTFSDTWGFDLFSYNDLRKSDQGQSAPQFVNLLADGILYIDRQYKRAGKKLFTEIKKQHSLNAQS